MPDARLTPAPPTRALLPSKAAIGGGLGTAALAALALAVASLKPDEGKSNRTYLDVAKIKTDCFGHTGSDVGKVGSWHTDAECEATLTGDARTTMTGVLACTPQLGDRPQQLAAATRLAYNIGVGAYCHSGTASAFNRQEYSHGCDLMLAWDKARVGGKLVQVPGLAARRQRERAMCLVGVS